LKKIVISQNNSEKNGGVFETKYDIYRNGNAKFEYRTVSSWKIHHKCQVGNDLYEIFGHKGENIRF
jgi:hypothetical protein